MAMGAHQWLNLIWIKINCRAPRGVFRRIRAEGRAIRRLDAPGAGAQNGATENNNREPDQAHDL